MDYSTLTAPRVWVDAQWGGTAAAERGNVGPYGMFQRARAVAGDVVGICDRNSNHCGSHDTVERQLTSATHSTYSRECAVDTQRTASSRPKKAQNDGIDQRHIMKAHNEGT